MSASEEMIKRIERETRYLIGDQAIQIIVLRAALEQAQQHPQESERKEPTPPEKARTNGATNLRG